MAYQHPGQVNKTGDQWALFIENYLTEVIAAFDAKNVLLPRVQSRTITHGKSAVFPTTWKTTAQYFIPGTTADLTGTNSLAHNKVTINVDRLLLSDILLYELDDVMNHWDQRAVYSDEQGKALATENDKNLIQLGILAAREAANARVTGSPGGTRIDTPFSTSADIRAALFTAQQKLAEKNVDTTDHSNLACILRPAQYYLLAQDTVATNKDYSGSGNIAQGTIPLFAGWPLFMSNNIPSTNLSQVTGTNNTYHGDFTKTKALAVHRHALATVKLKDLTLESEYLITKQADLFVAKMAVGHGITRAEGAVEFYTA
jgi:hypothetical protein